MDNHRSRTFNAKIFDGKEMEVDTPETRVSARFVSENEEIGDAEFAPVDVPLDISVEKLTSLLNAFKQPVRNILSWT